MTQEVQIYNGADVNAYVPQRFDRDQLELLKDTIAKGTTDNEFKLFIEVAERTGLNPFARQIYAIVRSGKMTIQTAIDGLRLIAQRSGDYAGQRGPEWCGDDGVWREVWLSKGHPAAARVGVLRHGFIEPVWGTATWTSYAQEQSPTWKGMPDVMIAKCAEALALRKAFPQELSGIYTDAEMHQTDREHTQPAREPFKKPQSRSQHVVNEDTGELPPSWTTKELGAALNSAGLKVGDLGALFGFPVNKDNVVDSVDRWLSDNENSTLPDLVAAAVEARFEPAPEDVVESEEQQPAMAMALE